MRSEVCVGGVCGGVCVCTHIDIACQSSSVRTFVLIIATLQTSPTGLGMELLVYEI